MANDASGPAFPGDAMEWVGRPGSEIKERMPKPGMTLRDYFAAKAMQGTLASTDNKSDWPPATEMAKAFYVWADAMLKARK